MWLEDPHRSDLFIFDTNTLQGAILLAEGASHLRYQEYAVFAKDADYASTVQSSDTDNDRPFLKHTPQFIVSEDDKGDALFHQAVRDDYAVDIHGNWSPRYKSVASGHLLQGKVRQVTCLRRPNPRSSEDNNLDGLHLTRRDYAAMDLHPATLQYVRRRAVESMFWDRHHAKLSIVMSFPADPRAPYDFLSMTYHVAERTTTVLIRQSFDPQQHNVDDLDQYDTRMQACKAHWAHPLVTPVMLLQVQFAKTERAVAENHSEVIAVERDVSNMAGFDAFDDSHRARRRRLSSSTTAAGPGGTVMVSPSAANGHGEKGIGHGSGHGHGGVNGTGSQPQVYKKSTELMKNAHDVLKRSIRLLDTLNWMERAIKILLDAGDQLEGVRSDAEEQTPSSAATDSFPKSLAQRGRAMTGMRSRIVDDPLTGHWHEIRQYLEGLQQLCLSLKTDRTILEMRCKALVDIVSCLPPPPFSCLKKGTCTYIYDHPTQIYSKMAQEDNNLNARMAVASSRDSSSMKALAVITAIFLPGEFMSSLFGMGIFDWQSDNGSSSSSGSSSSGDDDNDPVVGYDFWVYWAITIPLTIIILVLWRAWWVGQDRYFRKHLSKELSEERYWTDDRQPRQLETSFLYDFLFMSVRRGEATAENGATGFGMFQRSSTSGSNSDDERLKWFGKGAGGLPHGRQDSGLGSPTSTTFRLRQIAFEGVSPSKRRRMDSGDMHDV